MSRCVFFEPWRQRLPNHRERASADRRFRRRCFAFELRGGHFRAMDQGAVGDDAYIRAFSYRARLPKGIAKSGPGFSERL